MRDVRTAAALTVVSLLAGAVALGAAEFGAPVWIVLGLFAWLLTLGLPALAAVLLLVRIWPGPSIAAFLVLAALLAFLFQLAAVKLVGWWLRARRRAAVP